MLVNYHVPDFLFSYCAVAAVGMLDVKYSGEDLQKKKQKLISFLVLGRSLISACGLLIPSWNCGV